VDKLRKIGRWVWHNKERMILAVMVVFLCYRVYIVINPPQEVESINPQPPIERVEQIPPEVMPPPVTMRPPVEVPGNYTSLYRRNMFWVHSTLEQGEDNGEVTVEDLELNLVDIKEAGGRWRARMRTSTAEEWYDEGEQFEEFELIEIRQDEGCVEVYAERYGRRFTLCL